jgi:hypothetical protein
MHQLQVPAELMRPAQFAEYAVPNAFVWTCSPWLYLALLKSLSELTIADPRPGDHQEGPLTVAVVRYRLYRSEHFCKGRSALSASYLCWMFLFLLVPGILVRKRFFRAGWLRG